MEISGRVVDRMANVEEVEELKLFEKYGWETVKSDVERGGVPNLVKEGLNSYVGNRQWA